MTPRQRQLSLEFFDHEDVSCPLQSMRLALRLGLTQLGLTMADGEDRTMALGEEYAQAAWELHCFDHGRWAAVTCRLELNLAAAGPDAGVLHLLASLAAKPLRARRFLPLVAHTWLVGEPLPNWTRQRRPVGALVASWQRQGAGLPTPWLAARSDALLDHLQP